MCFQWNIFSIFKCKGENSYRTWRKFPKCFLIIIKMESFTLLQCNPLHVYLEINSIMYSLVSVQKGSSLTAQTDTCFPQKQVPLRSSGSSFQVRLHRTSVQKPGMLIQNKYHWLQSDGSLGILPFPSLLVSDIECWNLVEWPKVTPDLTVEAANVSVCLSNPLQKLLFH